ncbi:MAG: hypothetical protein IJ002_07380 [Clostridia bacterium]|nr:hypothetical protein [Clostridia bacterium]
MKKIALSLAAVMLAFSLTACGADKCHSCGTTEGIEKIGDHFYCTSCVLKGDMDEKDFEKALDDALEELGNLDLGDLEF